MVNRKTNKVIKKNKKTRKQRNNKTKRGGSGDEDKYKKVSIDVIITNGHDDKSKPIVKGEKRKLDFNVKSFYHFYDYLNDVDMFLKNTLNEELLAFTDPNKYEKWKATHKPKIYSYNYGYEEPKKDEANGEANGGGESG